MPRRITSGKDETNNDGDTQTPRDLRLQRVAFHWTEPDTVPPDLYSGFTDRDPAQEAVARAVIYHLPMLGELISFELFASEMSADLIFQPTPVQAAGWV